MRLVAAGFCAASIALSTAYSGLHPATASDLIVSIDGGATWDTVDVGTGDTPLEKIVPAVNASGTVP